MLTKRIIPCLDIHNRRVTKGIKFKNNIDLGDPVTMAALYYNQGCDELVLYDITASAEKRPIDIKIVKEVAKVIRIPFSVGGGISDLEDMSAVLMAGAEKISLNSLAVRDPKIIKKGAHAFGSQCIVLGMDPIASNNNQCPSGYEITIRGSREHTGIDALEWAMQAEDLGVGEIVVNSVDADGTGNGYEVDLTRMISNSVNVPVVASGGAGTPQHLIDVFQQANADAAIVAGMLHSRKFTIPEIKSKLAQAKIPVRCRW